MENIKQFFKTKLVTNYIIYEPYPKAKLIMKLPRKLKKRIIKTFGRGTYVGVINGYLTFKRYHNNRGVETIYTDKPLGDKFFHAHQYHPYLIFPNIKNSKQK